jgi:hypothetical protein
VHSSACANGNRKCAMVDVGPLSDAIVMSFHMRDAPAPWFKGAASGSQAAKLKATLKSRSCVEPLAGDTAKITIVLDAPMELCRY